jgi:hypothetical protein
LNKRSIIALFFPVRRSVGLHPFTSRRD